jgi:hypothetical protein
LTFVYSPLVRGKSIFSQVATLQNVQCQVQVHGNANQSNGYHVHYGYHVYFKFNSRKLYIPWAGWSVTARCCGAPRISSVPYSTLAQGGRIKSAITQVIMLYIRNFLIRHLWSYLNACINSIMAALVQSTEPSANIQANTHCLKFGALRGPGRPPLWTPERVKLTG